METFELMEIGLGQLVTISKFFLEAFSVMCVIVGFFKSLQLAIQLSRRRNRYRIFNKVRLKFGMWLALALEFQLAADILATTKTPTLETLGQLGLIAVIRTFLNYFLGKELEVEIEFEKNPEASMNDPFL
jgi:uncharacterized membrane protein